MFTIYSLKNGLDNVTGFSSSGVKAGLKKDGYDVGFIYSDTPCDVVALFTQNRFQAAPLKHFKKYGDDFQTNFVLVNSKNANAMTMAEGIEDIEEILEHAKSKYPDIQNPIMSSTGVIGVRLPKEKIKAGIEQFNIKEKNSELFSQAIMTTDKFQKVIAYEVVLDNGEKFHIAGVAKGAGMINPSMATMLCFITTDADIPKADMSELLKEHNESTFNAVSVDGDTSTNDSLFLLANRASGVYNKEAFSIALKQILEFLSIEVLRDGEGSTKVVAFEVKGAKDVADAEKIAKTLSNSLLIKTALFGQDPNWGRIAMGIGASGAESDETKLTIAFEDVLLYENGKNLFDEVVEEKAYKVMSKEQFKIICDLGIGDGSFTAYGCDLGYEYVKINADYRT